MPPLRPRSATGRNHSDLGGTVPFVYRYHPMVREARARIRRGDAGALLTVDASYLQDWLLSAEDENWRVDASSGGPSRAFADIGSHLVDLIEFITGEHIMSVVATTRTVHPRRGGAEVTTEDTVAMTVELSGGGIGSILVISSSHRDARIDSSSRSAVRRRACGSPRSSRSSCGSVAAWAVSSSIVTRTRCLPTPLGCARFRPVIRRVIRTRSTRSSPTPTLSSPVRCARACRLSTTVCARRS